MVNFMKLIKSFLVAPYFLGMILGGVFLGIYVLIDKIIESDKRYRLLQKVCRILQRRSRFL